MCHTSINELWKNLQARKRRVRDTDVVRKAHGSHKTVSPIDPMGEPHPNLESSVQLAPSHFHTDILHNSVRSSLTYIHKAVAALVTGIKYMSIG